MPTITVAESRIRVQHDSGVALLDPSIGLVQLQREFDKLSECGIAPATFVLLGEGRRLSSSQLQTALDEPSSVRRGRFVTPAVESGALADEAIPLVLVSNREPSDWRDWLPVLAAQYSPIVSVSVGAAAGMPVQGTIGVDEACAAMPSGTTDTYRLTMQVLSGALARSPDGFESTASHEDLLAREVTLPYETTLAPRPGNDVAVLVELSRDAKVVATARAEILAPRPTNEDVDLTRRDDQILRIAIRAYANAMTGYMCPHCDRTHNFSVPFVCSASGLSVLESVDMTSPGWYAALATGGSARLSRCDELTAVSSHLLRRDEGGWVLLAGDASGEARALERITEAVFFDRETQICVVRAGGEGR